ncbi:MAG: hypothetical protein ACM3XM_20975 [Mycobacterium leprae]
MQILLILVIASIVVTTVFLYRRSQDRRLIGEAVISRGGQVTRLARVGKKGPFRDVGRGWWAWRVEWRGANGPHTSWALTTREGLKEWRD